MRRRQVLVETPHPVMATELEHINTSRLPAEAPRRRAVFSQQHVDDVPVIETPSMPPPRKRGRPSTKDKAA